MPPHSTVTVDADFPGGNIVVDRIEADSVDLRPDFRDTEGAWFYWCFRMRGAGGKRIAFRFRYEDGKAIRGCIGSRGPAISLDGGMTWRWLGLDNDQHLSFSFQFPGDCDDAFFGMGMTYTQRHLDAFLQSQPSSPRLRREILCATRKKRDVERLHVGSPTAPLALIVSARHHCCEMMASYVVEGIMDTLLAEDDRGRWFSQNIEAIILPFADKDGVEDGDQGKNRKPRDHNRDYDPNSVHAEPAALQQFVPPWLNGRRCVFLDLHCPWLYGGINEMIYQVGQNGEAVWQRQQRFGQILQEVKRGPLPYLASDDLPFGQAWNTAASFSKGLTAGMWAATLPHCELATVLEIPYANASGQQVDSHSARLFGHDLAAAIQQFCRTLAPAAG